MFQTTIQFYQVQLPSFQPQKESLKDLAQVLGSCFYPSLEKFHRGRCSPPGSGLDPQREGTGPRGKDGKGPLKKHATTNLANNRWTYVVHGGDNPFTKQNGDLI